MLIENRAVLIYNIRKIDIHIGERIDMGNKNWSREEEIIVFNLYCKIPFKSSSKTHPEVIKIAEIIGRTPSAVNMKIGNFGSFDDNLKSQGISGLTNASKLDRDIFAEFNGKWDELAYESEQLIAKYEGRKLSEEQFEVPMGMEKSVTVKQRINQRFFRESVLASYENACCITGLANPELLIASHIKPWKSCEPCERTNPRNGICLNALHDKAFDRGFITLSSEYKIIVSENVKDICDGKSVEMYFNSISDKKIRLPDKFLPDKRFIEYHNDCIFENWR